MTDPTWAFLQAEEASLCTLFPISAPRTRGAPMFDTLTTIELERHIAWLTAECRATHRKMIGPGLTPLISPMSDEWRVLSARHAELGETIEAAYAELIRREQEARADD